MALDLAARTETLNYVSQHPDVQLGNLTDRPATIEAMLSNTKEWARNEWVQGGRVLRSAQRHPEAGGKEGGGLCVLRVFFSPPPRVPLPRDVLFPERGFDRGPQLSVLIRLAVLHKGGEILRGFAQENW